MASKSILSRFRRSKKPQVSDPKDSQHVKYTAAASPIDPSIIYDSVPLDQGKASIRLLSLERDSKGRIHGLLESFDLSSRWAGYGYTGTQCPDYIALSYAWGDSSPERHIILQGSDFIIRSNLFDALHAIMDLRDKFEVSLWELTEAFGGLSSPELRPDASSTPIRHYWIDAICINQSLVTERNHQVGYMSSIYSHSALAISWLGPGNTDLRNAMRFVKNVEAVEASASKSNDSISLLTRHQGGSTLVSTTDRALGIAQLCHLEYFRRMWILQEVLLARTNVMLCGQEILKFPLNAILGLGESRVVSVLGVPDWYDTPLGDLMHHKFYYRSPRESDGDLSIRLWAHQLLNLVCRYGAQKCQDPRDRVFALLGIIKQPDTIEGPMGEKSPFRIEADYACSPIELLLRTMALPGKTLSDRVLRLLLDALRIDPDLEIPFELTRIRRFRSWRQMITSSEGLMKIRSLDWTMVDQWPQHYKALSATYAQTNAIHKFKIGELCVRGTQLRLWAMQGEVESAYDTEVRTEAGYDSFDALQYWARLTLGMTVFIEDSY